MDKTQELLRRIELKCQEIYMTQGSEFSDNVKHLKCVQVSREIRSMIEGYRESEDNS